MSVFSSGPAILRQWSDQALEDRDPRRDGREAALLLMAAAFVLTNAVAFSLSRDSAIAWPHLFAPICWLVIIVAAHLTIRTFRPSRDPFLLPVFALLTGWSLLLQDRLAPNFLARQTLWFALATAAMLAAAIIPRTLQPLQRYRYVLVLGGLLLLGITLLFGVNPSGSGAALWLPIPVPFLQKVHFQPSELLKLLLVIFLASYFTEQEPIHRLRREVVNRESGGKRRPSVGAFWRHLPFLGPLLVMWGFTMFLLVWQKDLGAAALFFIVFVALVYLATGELVYVWSGLALLILAGIIAFFAFDTVVAPRVLSWLNPWPNVSDRAYQIVQALYAIAGGGLFGQGIGYGFPDYIPVVHSDFALAAIAEEWGLLGSLTIVACFALLAGRGLHTALLAIRASRPNHFHAYLAAGLVTLLSVQAILIMGGTTRLLPLTGITLPFVSYGGSSLLISGLALGLLLYLSADAEPAPPVPPTDKGLARRLERLGVVLLIIFSIVAATLAYWAVIRSDSMLAREDNPRLVESERRIQRGRILDRNDVALAVSANTAGGLERLYPIPEAGPAVGYYSWRFGSAGVENAFDAHLRGQDRAWWNQVRRKLLHEPQIGGDVRLTLDAGLQEAATKRMVAGTTGGLVLLELTEVGGAAVARVRAMVSLPGYDPNLIDDQFETFTADDPGQLFDRAARGLYQPGQITQSPIVAAAVESGFMRWQDALIDASLPVIVDGQVMRCIASRDEVESAVRDWADMAQLRCPRPLHDLGLRLGATTLDDTFDRFGLRRPPALEIPTGGNDATTTDPGLAAVGQASLTVTPLQAALATAALAGDGRLPVAQLVDAVSGSDGKWTTQTPGGGATSPRAVSAETAAATRATWLEIDGVREFAISALAGPGGSRDSWYLGMAPAASPRFVVALVLENEADITLAEQIGRDVLKLVIAP